MSAGAAGLDREKALQQAEALLGDLTGDIHLNKERLVIVVPADDLPQAATRLRDDKKLSLKYLTFVGGIDYQDRLDVVYILRSINHAVPVELRVELDPDHPSLPTVSNIWSTANWHEREAWDLLGITFTGHPDLRRILTRGEDDVFPLRKDARPHRVKRDEWQFEGIKPPLRLPGELDRSKRS